MLFALGNFQADYVGQCDRCLARNVVCQQLAGTVRCLVCSKARKTCEYLHSAEGAKGKAREVGPVLDAAEESEGEEEEEEDEDEEGEEAAEEPDKPEKTHSPAIRVLRRIVSPLKSIGKRQTTDLSPGSVKDREAESSQRSRTRHHSPEESLEVPIVSRFSSPYHTTMPPPSSTYSGAHTSEDHFFVRRLENDLRASREDLSVVTRRWRESQEDLGMLVRRHQANESLLLEEIASLKARLGEGSSGRGGSSGRRGGAGSAAGR